MSACCQSAESILSATNIHVTPEQLCRHQRTLPHTALCYHRQCCYQWTGNETETSNNAPQSTASPHQTRVGRAQLVNQGSVALTASVTNSNNHISTTANSLFTNGSCCWIVFRFKQHLKTCWFIVQTLLLYLQTLRSCANFTFITHSLTLWKCTVVSRAPVMQRVCSPSLIFVY